MVKNGPAVPYPMMVAMKESEFSNYGQIFGFETANTAISGMNFMVRGFCHIFKIFWILLILKVICPKCSNYCYSSNKCSTNTACPFPDTLGSTTFNCPQYNNIYFNPIDQTCRLRINGQVGNVSNRYSNPYDFNSYDFVTRNLYVPALSSGNSWVQFNTSYQFSVSPGCFLGYQVRKICFEETKFLNLKNAYFNRFLVVI